jgi:hypothetical protein
MAGHNRSKKGVLSHAHVPAIYVFRFFIDAGDESDQIN